MSIFILQICYVAVLAEEWTGGLSPHDSTTSPFSRCPHEIQDLKVHHPEPLEEEHIVPGGLVPEVVLLVQEVLKPKALIRLEGKLSIGSPGTAPGPHAADQRGMSRDGTVTSAPPEQLPCSPRACHCSLCSAHCWHWLSGRSPGCPGAAADSAVLQTRGWWPWPLQWALCWPRSGLATPGDCTRRRRRGSALGGEGGSAGVGHNQSDTLTCIMPLSNFWIKVTKGSRMNTFIHFW